LIRPESKVQALRHRRTRARAAQEAVASVLICAHLVDLCVSYDTAAWHDMGMEHCGDVYIS